MINITKEQLKAIMPMTTNYQIVSFHVPLLETMERFKINNKERKCAFLAQLAHESGCLRYVVELASGDAYTNRADLGNTQPLAIQIAESKGTNTGRLYKGRGLIQITGFYNYQKLGEYFGQDFIHEPKMLEQPKWATMSAGWFWESRNLNHLADQKKFKTITKLINGGLNGYNDRLYYYERAWQVL